MESRCDTVIRDMDLLTEILLKQAIQCKCVCKKWLSIISNPKFRYSHTCRLYSKYNNNPPPTALLVQNVSDTKLRRASFVPLNTNNESNKTFHPDLHGSNLLPSIMHSCNGLLLWNVHYPSNLSQFPEEVVETYLEEACHFRICNPAIRRDDHSVRLDYPDAHDAAYSDDDDRPFSFDPFALKAYLVFEPLKQPLSYKVISFGEESSPFKYRRYSPLGPMICKPRIEIRLYTSETCRWRKVVCNLPDDLRVTKGVYCNSAIHWFRLLDHDNSVYFDTNRLCFDKLPRVPSVGDDLDSKPWSV
ncbi:hypothetical protein S83_040091 [Arachis hypogaea]|nr:uncharacterized protein DS421_12g381730 [Arachis hypogaea]